METFFKKQYTVHIHECDHNGYLSPVSLCNYLQTTADSHAKSMGTSVQQVTESNLTWVYSRIHLKVDLYPRLYGTFCVETWRSIVKGPYGYREFRILNQNKEEIARATSSVALIDYKKRKPVDIPENLLWQFEPSRGRVIEDNFNRLPVPEEYTKEKSFSVRLSDLDINRHVNSMTYVDWIIESVPEEILFNKKLEEIEVAYRGEVHYGDNIISKSVVDSDKVDTFMHCLQKNKDGIITTLGRTSYGKLL